MNDKNRQFELEKQLHEQYAINNNANTGTLVALLAAIMVIFTAYGLAFKNLKLESCPYNQRDEEIVLFFLTFVIQIVLSFLSLLIVHFGYVQRRDQNVINAIREKYYQDGEKLSKEYWILYLGYQPYTGDGYVGLRKFLPGFYNLFFRFFLICLFTVTLLTSVSILCCCCQIFLLFFFVFLFIVVCIELICKAKKVENQRAKIENKLKQKDL